MNLYDELIAIVDVLNAAQIEYALCGGLAVAMHGYPRFTEDIDLLIRESDLDAVVNAIKPLGYVFDEGIPELGNLTGREPVRLFRISKPIEKELLTLDLLLTSPSQEHRWKDRLIVLWEGREVPIVSLRVLAEMKRQSARPKDKLDLEALGLSNGNS